MGIGGPYWIRTSGLRIRSPTLYPTELRAQTLCVLRRCFVRPSTTAGCAGLRSGRTEGHPALFYFKLGGKGGIRTLEPGCPSYWFSKPAPSAARPPFLEARFHLAEEEGFEPSEGVNPLRFSRPPPSAARPLLRKDVNPEPSPELRDAGIYGIRAGRSRGNRSSRPYRSTPLGNSCFVIRSRPPM